MDIPKLPHGEGSMYMHNDDTLAYKKTIHLKNGRKVRKTVFGATPKECLRRMRIAENELNRLNPENTKVTLIEGVLGWLREVHRHTVKQQTYERLVRTANNQIEKSDIGHMRYADIRPEHIQSLINSLNDRGYSYSIIKKTYDLLNAFYRYASAKDDIPNPMLLVTSPKSTMVTAETKQVEWFDEDEIQRFIQACGHLYKSSLLPKYKYGYALASNLYLGLRGGELLALQWKDIDFQRQTIAVTKTLVEMGNPEYDPKNNTQKVIFVVQHNTKTYHNRYVPINEKAKDLLNRHLANSKYIEPNDFVISTVNRKTATLKNLQDSIRAIEREAGINKPSNTHILRHTCASLYFKAGVPVEVICKILGNTREVCEKTYIHFVEEQMRNAASQVVPIINI